MSTVIVGLVADPGLPEKIVRAVADDLTDQLKQETGPEEVWDVQISREPLPLDSEGEIPFLSLTQRLKNEKKWDYFFYVTDLPRTTNETPMLVEIDHETKAALISLPALGAVGIRAKVQKLILALVHLLQERRPATTAAVSDAIGIGRVTFLRGQEPGDSSYLTMPGRSSRLRLLMGMIRSNRPGRLLPALSSSIAAAAATGAFGIFYASIWSMADALSPLRLLLVSVLAITALSGWLILHNGLWNKAGGRSSSESREAARDNASTVITVLLSVTLMYLVLYVVVLCGALAVISGDYLQSQLGHPVSFLDYAKLSWLAASLGAVAGALGSNFDSDEAIREATYSRRQHERRKLADSYED